MRLGKSSPVAPVRSSTRPRTYISASTRSSQQARSAVATGGGRSSSSTHVREQWHSMIRARAGAPRAGSMRCGAMIQSAGRLRLLTGRGARAKIASISPCRSRTQAPRRTRSERSSACMKLIASDARAGIGRGAGWVQSAGRLHMRTGQGTRPSAAPPEPQTWLATAITASSTCPQRISVAFGEFRMQISLGGRSDRLAKRPDRASSPLTTSCERPGPIQLHTARLRPGRRSPTAF